jgi:putative glycosyltransferase (TIGR04372 family)
VNLGRFGVRFLYALNRVRDEGLLWTTKEVALRAALWLLWLGLVPLSLPLHLAGYRRLPVLTQRIGHLAAEVDCFLKKVRLGQIDGAGKRFFILAPKHKVANACLLDYWRDYLTVVNHPVACWLLELMTRGPLMRFGIKNYVLAIGRAAEYFAVQATWADRPALLQLRPEHKSRGEQFLKEVGLPEGAWFVCFHSRDGGYSARDESVHGYRNLTVEFLIPAMQEIVALGGWCVRMGDASTKPLAPMAGVIDYAHHRARSAELDVFLCASCRFFLGNTSGLFLVSSIFGIPSALTNQTPFAATGFRPGDLSIPKPIRYVGHSEFLTAAEILSHPVANFRMARFYAEADLEIVENTADEIRDLVLEMIDTLEGRSHETAEVALLRSGFNENLRPDHYCYGTKGKLSATFLLRHRSMFLEPPAAIDESLPRTIGP